MYPPVVLAASFKGYVRQGVLNRIWPLLAPPCLADSTQDGIEEGCFACCRSRSVVAAASRLEHACHISSTAGVQAAKRSTDEAQAANVSTTRVQAAKASTVETPKKSQSKRIVIIAASSGAAALSIGILMALLIWRSTRTKGKALGNHSHGKVSGRDTKNPYAAFPGPPEASKRLNSYHGLLLPS
jgi:hypothetical protein